MAKTIVDRVIAKQIDAYHIYLKYAMDDFIMELDTIKQSIANSVKKDLLSRHVAITPEIEQQIVTMVEKKLSTIAKIKFEE